MWPGLGRESADGFNKCAKMRWRCATTSSYNAHTQVLHKMGEILREFFRGKVIMRNAAYIFR